MAKNTTGTATDAGAQQQLSDTVTGSGLSDGIIWGTAGGDLLDQSYTGDPDGDLIDAGDARPPAQPEDDRIRAGGGDDTVLSGLGNDEIWGAGGNDLIDGGAGGDTANGDAGDDSLFGAEGDDSLMGDAGADLLSGGQGNDVLSGGDDADLFIDLTSGDVIDGGEGGDDRDTLNLSSWGKQATNIILDPGNPENGVVEFLDPSGNIVGTLTFRNIENIVPCFTPGTVIATPKGERPVEELAVGDRIVTRDNGIQEIRWVGARTLNHAQLTLDAHLKPVLLTQGCLGNGLPERDIMVSPNHRFLVASERTLLYFEEHEVLVAAKHLVNNRSIKPVDPLGVTYIHFMCDRHEVVLANGCWTESFQPGDYSLNGLGNAQRTEIYEIFPDLAEASGRKKFGSARRTLRRHEAKLLHLNK